MSSITGPQDLTQSSLSKLRDVEQIIFAGNRVLDAEYKLRQNIKIAMLYLEDDEAVNAETFIKKASSLITACKVRGNFCAAVLKIGCASAAGSLNTNITACRMRGGSQSPLFCIHIAWYIVRDRCKFPDQGGCSRDQAA